MNEPQPPPSPLAEADPLSLDELFARFDSHIQARTLGLPPAQADLLAIVSELRKQREAWAVAEASGATKAPRAKKAAPPTTTTLDDLGL